MAEDEKNYKYLIKIPIDPESENIEYKETKFCNKEDVIKFLEITNGQFLRLANNTIKCKSYTNSKLKGIKLERIGFDNTKKDKDTRKKSDEEYRKTLLAKLEKK
jgi:hypothetical protein